MTSHDSFNFSLQFKILLRFVVWKLKKIRFSNSHTWNSTILPNLNNYFHNVSHFSCQINSFQWFSYFRSMNSTSFQQFLFPKSQKSPNYSITLSRKIRKIGFNKIFREITLLFSFFMNANSTQCSQAVNESKYSLVIHSVTVSECFCHSDFTWNQLLIFFGRSNKEVILSNIERTRTSFFEHVWKMHFT